MRTITFALIFAAPPTPHDDPYPHDAQTLLHAPENPTHLDAAE
jgi:hypothetical protein